MKLTANHRDCLIEIVPGDGFTEITIYKPAEAFKMNISANYQVSNKILIGELISGINDIIDTIDDGEDFGKTNKLE